MTNEAALTAWLVSSVLLSLRIAPLFAFSPPFSLVPLPAPARAMLGVGLAATLAGAAPSRAILTDLGPGALASAAAGELMVGLALMLAFQLPFAALSLAGRMIDTQAGFGLAGLIDPTTRSQTSLSGMLLGYGGGMVFFALNGHLALLRIFAATLTAAPIGHGGPAPSLDGLLGYVGTVFMMGLGAGGMVVLALFLTDMTIAFVARTAPQMNVLMVGFQVKTGVFLLVWPLALGVAGATLARMIAYAISRAPELAF